VRVYFVARRVEKTVDLSVPLGIEAKLHVDDVLDN